MQSPCPHCGAPQTVAGTFCSACGKRLQAPAGACPPASPGKSLSSRLAARMLPMLLTWLPAWVLHTYLLVVKNEGYSGFQHWSSPYLNVPGNGLTSVLAFAVGSAWLWSLLQSLWSQGPAATLKHWADIPRRRLPALLSQDPSSRLGLALGLGLTLQGCRWLGLTPQSRLLLAGGALLWGAGEFGRLAGDLVGRRLSGLTAKYKSLDPYKLSTNLLAALPLAFLVSWLASDWLSDKLGWLALVYAGYRLYPRAGGASLFVYFGWWWLICHGLGQPAWADDGGWVEATGDGGLTTDNLIKWWTSVGSGRAIAQGILPAAAATLGAGLAPDLKGQDPNRIIGYILQISRDQFQLGVGQTEALEVSVWSVTAGGAQAPATTANIQLAVPDWPGLSVTPTGGTGSLHVSLSWQGGGQAPEQPLTLVVRASAGATTHQANVRLQLAGGDYDLVVTVYSAPF